MTRRKIIAVLTGLILAMATLAGLTEFRFGQWYPQRDADSTRQGGSWLGVHWPANQIAMVSPAGLYPDARDFTFRRDRWGFRGLGTDPADVFILVMGGSATEQFFLDDDRTWPSRLGQLLSEAGPAITVANAGLDGMGTAALVEAWDGWLSRLPGLKPHFVLVMVGGDDAAAWPATPHPATKSGLDSVLSWTFLHDLLKSTDDRPTHPAQAIDFDTQAWTRQPAQPDQPGPDIARHRAGLHALAARIHAQGAVPVFITERRADYRPPAPDGRSPAEGIATAIGQPNGLDRHHWLSALNAATREICAQDGLLCLDMARDLPVEPGDFHDATNLTPQGAEAVARWLHARLAGLV